jgi:hypothetical protein
MTTAYYQNLIRNLRLIVKCGICGHRQKLQFHHIKPTKLNGESRGQNKRFRDIVNHPDCYIPLCYFCHQKVTSDAIEIGLGKLGLLYFVDRTIEGISIIDFVKVI